MAIHEQKWMQHGMASVFEPCGAGWVIAKLCPEHAIGSDLYSAKEFNAKAKEWHKLRREAGIEKPGDANEKTV